MTKVNIHQAKTQFSRLVELAAGGEEVIIAKSGKPVARLVPYVTKGAVRQPGGMRGKIRIKKNFDAPLPKELLDSFRHALTAGRLPALHRDPFDRMLVAQASVEELRVVSHDRVFERYGLSGEGLPPIIV